MSSVVDYLDIELSYQEQEQARTDALQECVETGVYPTMDDAVASCSDNKSASKVHRYLPSPWVVMPTAVAVAALAFTFMTEQRSAYPVAHGYDSGQNFEAGNLYALHDECYSGDIIPDGSVIRGNSLMVTKDAETVRFMGAGAISVVEEDVKINTIQVCGAGAALLMNGKADNVAVLGADARLQVTHGSVGTAVVSGADCFVEGSSDIKQLSAPYCEIYR